MSATADFFQCASQARCARVRISVFLVFQARRKSCEIPLRGLAICAFYGSAFPRQNLRICKFIFRFLNPEFLRCSKLFLGPVKPYFTKRRLPYSAKNLSAFPWKNFSAHSLGTLAIASETIV